MRERADLNFLGLRIRAYIVSIQLSFCERDMLPAPVLTIPLFSPCCCDQLLSITEVACYWSALQSKRCAIRFAPFTYGFQYTTVRNEAHPPSAVSKIWYTPLELAQRFATLLNQKIRVNLFSQSGSITFACYFLVILAFSLAKRKALPGKTLYLFRALLPSWRFFEDFDEAPTLYFRYATEAEEMRKWEKCLRRPNRRVTGLLFNPETNFVLAAGSVVQQLISEVSDLTDTDTDSVEKLISYQLTQSLVQFQLPQIADRYQFKVSGVSEDILVSPIYTVERAQR